MSASSAICVRTSAHAPAHSLTQAAGTEDRPPHPQISLSTAPSQRHPVLQALLHGPMWWERHDGIGAMGWDHTDTLQMCVWGEGGEGRCRKTGVLDWSMHA